MITAQQAFEDADANHDGVLSWEEFEAWYSANNASSAGAAAVEGAQDAAAQDAAAEGQRERDPESLSVGEVKAITGLGR